MKNKKKKFWVKTRSNFRIPVEKVHADKKNPPARKQRAEIKKELNASKANLVDASA